MRDDYAHAYRHLYRQHWWWRAREELLVAVLRRHVAGQGAQRILDIGCGGGVFFGRLSEFGAVEGVEPDPAMRLGRPEIDNAIHWGPLETFKPKGRFTVVLLLDVLEHLTDPSACLARVRDLVAPGGIVVATVPAFPALWTLHDDMNEHVVRYTKQSFRCLLKTASYKAYVLEYFFHWLFPVKLGVRFVEWLQASRRQGPHLPSVPPRPINEALCLLSRLEQGSRISRIMPFGSSLLFVGAPLPLSR